MKIIEKLKRKIKQVGWKMVGNDVPEFENDFLADPEYRKSFIRVISFEKRKEFYDEAVRKIGKMALVSLYMMECENYIEADYIFDLPGKEVKYHISFKKVEEKLKNGEQ